MVLIPHLSFAECSWILWIRERVILPPHREQIEWKIVNAYPNYKECIENKKVAQTKLWNSISYMSKNLVHIKSVVQFEDGTIVEVYKEREPTLPVEVQHTFFCFPDVFNPK